MKEQVIKHKALLILPLMLLPFVVLIFYILGGGEHALAEAGGEQKNRGVENGMNYQLPQAEKSIEIYDKMEAYEKREEIPGEAGIPAAQRRELMENEGLLLEMETDSLPEILKEEPEQVPAKLLAHIRKKELKVQEEMKEGRKPQSKAVIRRAAPPKKESMAISTHQPVKAKTQNLESLEDLEGIFESHAELERRNDSLQYFLSHAQDELQKIQKSKRNVFQLESRSERSFNGEQTGSSLIKAEIYEDAVVLDGNRVKLRLLQEYRIAGKKVEQNTFVYGICKLNKERLFIQISQFPVRGEFLPVDLQVHDTDGLPGLYIPDRAARKVTREVGAQTSISPLWGSSQDALTHIGITTADRTAQTLIRRVRLKKVRLRKNSIVYIINQN
ncbi:conjugative transposon protein TraM [Marinifilum sp. D714]|uniref:conjugative transposon protein TraM n=1 Tax=Marinifilum sp. D714 TaxID=2937523 RepID=UPI0027C4029D|nr:conjugative transposon protein TraM [Marinifilum sp. D714]MDQ2178567.1 conjugative transposon protein TraM [Marinifilum sp. D714]